MKSQAIANLLAQFPREEEFSLDDEVPREVAMTEVATSEWVMKFNRSSKANSRGTGVVLYYRKGETIALSLKLKFSCSNNNAKYKAYLTGLAMALKMGV